MSKFFQFLNSYDRAVKSVSGIIKLKVERILLPIESKLKFVWFWILRKKPKIIQFSNVEIPYKDVPLTFWIEVKNTAYFTLNGKKYSARKNIVFIDERQSPNIATLTVYGYGKNKVIHKELAYQKPLMNKFPKPKTVNSFSTIEQANRPKVDLKKKLIEVNLGKVKLETKKVNIHTATAKISLNTDLYYQYYDQRNKTKKA